MTNKTQQFALFMFLVFFAVACGDGKEGEESKENTSEESGEEKAPDNRSATAHKNEVVEMNKSAEIYAIGAGVATFTIKSITMDFFPEGKEVLLGDDEEIIRFDLEITNENEKDFDFNYTAVRLNSPDQKNATVALIINESNADDLLSEQEGKITKGNSIKGALYFTVKKGTTKEDISLVVEGYDSEMNEKNTEIFLKAE